MIVVVLAALVVNARMLLYSAALAPHTADWPTRWRWASAYFLADPVYALATTRFEGPSGTAHARDRFRYYLSVGVLLWVGWMAMTGAGMLLGGVLPDWRLDLASPLTFLLLLPMLRGRAAYAAAATGGIVAVVASGLPLGLGLLLGAAAGIAAAGTYAGGRHG